MLANIGNFVSLATGSGVSTSLQDEARVRGMALKAAEAAQAAIKAGDRAAILGSEAAGKSGRGTADMEAQARAAEAATKARERGLKAAQDLAELEEREAAKRRSDVEQEIADVRRVGAERRRLLNEQIAAERAREEGAREAVLRALRDRRAGSYRQEAADVGSVIARAVTAAARAAADRLKEAARQRADFDDELRRQELQQAEADARSKVEAARTPEDKAAAERELAEARRRSAEEQARRFAEDQIAQARKAYGDDPGKLAAAEARIRALVERMKFVPGAVDQVAAKSGTVGTFSAVSAGLLGGGGAALRTAKAVELLVQLQKDANQALRRIGLPGFT